MDSTRGRSGFAAAPAAASDIRKTRFESLGHPAGGFAEDGEVPQERFAPFPVGFKLADGHVYDQVLGLLGPRRPSR